MAEGDAACHTCRHIVTGQIITVTPTRLTVVHLHHLKHLLILFRSFLLNGQYQIILCGSYRITSLGQTANPTGTFACWSHLIEHTFPALTFLLYPGDGLRQPSCLALGLHNGAGSLYLLQFVVPTRLSATLCGLPGYAGILPVRRDRDITHALAICDVVYHKGMLGIECRRHLTRCINRHADGVRIFRLSQILNGDGVVLGGEFQFRSGRLTVDKELIVLGALHLNLTFQIVAVVHIKR